MHKRIHFLLLLITNLLSTCLLIAHGFAPSTPVKLGTKAWPIEQAFQNPHNQTIYVSSWYQNKNSDCSFDELNKVVRAGQSITNCYMRLKFNADSTYDICCTPSQEFFDVAEQSFVPAFQLKPGSMLASAFGDRELTEIIFIKEPLPVYMIEVQKNHTFYAGRFFVLTHNMPLPFAFASLGISFGAGAASGAAAGSFWGPITCAGGILIGGAVGIAARACVGLNNVQYALHFDVERIEKRIAGCEFNEKEADAQAPGKPTENDGFYPKKNWDGKRVKHPKTGQVGYPDKKKNVWVPTGPGPLAHRGPHWDVVDKKGRHKNVLPGGREC